jgi:hypothetical protein
MHAIDGAETYLEIPTHKLLSTPKVARATARRLAMGQEINVLALVKGEEKYIFLFDD